MVGGGYVAFEFAHIALPDRRLGYPVYALIKDHSDPP